MRVGLSGMGAWYQFSSERKYLRGFRNTHAVEFEPGCLPAYTNPKNPPNNLVTEQFTGPQGFTGEASSGGPLRLWLYKYERSVKVGRYNLAKVQPFKNVQYQNPGPNPIKTRCVQAPTTNVDFVNGLVPYAENDHIYHYNYSFNQSMKDNNRVFHNADGEILIQPSVGRLEILTECGILELQPGTIGVIPKNMKFQVNLQPCSKLAQGVITELRNDRSFRIPHKGPIGANGLANPEYFETPAPFVDKANLDRRHEIYCKMQNEFFQAELQTSPFDVFAWKGNYAPYRFNLDDFVPIIAGQRDHLDPSSHIVLAVGSFDGANVVELVCFAPRFNVTTEQYPTYLPPYDHRNNGKSEIMHYLGGYDAREGSLPGFQTVHDMGVAHGNDQKTFDAARSGENKVKYLNFPPATMVELTGCLRINKDVLENQDPNYGDQIRGRPEQKTSKNRPKEADVGGSKRITFTALEESLVPVFSQFMPNPDISFNEKTGLTVRDYYNSSGNVFQVRSQYDQNRFWEVYKGVNPQTDVQRTANRNAKQATDEELLEVTKTMQSFFNRGTVVQTLDLEADEPLKTAQYYKNQGFQQGLDSSSISLEKNSPFSFRFIPTGLMEKNRKNHDSYVSTIDHTVINVYGKELPLMFKLFPEVFWGGDPRDLRAPGVQFYTRVLTNNLETVPQMIPVNNLDESEEEILRRIQEDDSFLPPYIRDAAMGNQITRGLVDTNRTFPKQSRNAFLQHIAMAVNQKFGDISDHLARLQKQGVQLIPGPPAEYYRLSEIDLVQRVSLPTLFLLEGYDAFQLPYNLFNGLLKPKDASVDRLRQILLDSQVNPTETEKILKVYIKMQPVLELIAAAVDSYDPSKFQRELTQKLQTQGFQFTQNHVEVLQSLFEFNKKKLAKARQIGSLIDFQIIYRRDQSGYLDQTFSVPVTQKTEGTSGIFLEFIVRTCYDDIFDLIKKGQITAEATIMKSCGAFGQGNFANLMLGQQKGIENVDRQMKELEKSKGEIFRLPLLDLDTIRNDPIQHLQTYIEKCKLKGETKKLASLKQSTENISTIIEEAKKRKIWK